MILLAFLAQTAAPVLSCSDQIRDDPVQAAATANVWHGKGGAALARQRAGLAYAAQERWPQAALAFEQAARETVSGEERAAASLWVQAGNARLAGGEAPAAIAAFDRARVAKAELDRLGANAQR